MLLLAIGPVVLVGVGLHTGRIQRALDEAQQQYDSRRRS
jgi:hypothetical protein